MLKKFIFCLAIFYNFAVHAQDLIGDEFSVSTIHKVLQGDSLYKLAWEFDLGLNEILRANPNISNPDFIRRGQKIILPTTHLLPNVTRRGIVINLAEPRLYFFADSFVDSFPVSVGADEKTPTGQTKIILKRENPTWTPPASIRAEDPTLPEVVPAGPENPLGNYALNLDATKNNKWQRVVIHGTNAPRSIGAKVSHGCIRLYPWDIKTLFEAVEIGVPVRIIDQPIKVNEIDEKIYAEFHLPEKSEENSINIDSHKIICRAVKDCESRVDWQKVDDGIEQNSGVPFEIGKK